MRMKKSKIFCLLLLVLPLLLSLPVAATGEADKTVQNEEVAAGWQALVDTLPPEVADLLPPTFFDGDMVAVGESADEASAFSAVLRVISRLSGVIIGESLSLLALLVGVLLLAAVVRAAVKVGDGMQRALSFLVALAVTLLIVGSGGARFAEIAQFFELVRSISVALVPLMGTLYAMGGNIGAAVANHGVMSGFLAILETVCCAAVVPVGAIATAMALIDATCDKSPLRALSALIKRGFTLGLSFLMMLLSFVLGMQTTLARASDTLALRTARFAAGSFLPVVGSSVGEALRTVAGSVQYLRGAVGVGGVLVIFFAFLPTFLSVLFTRLALLISGAVAGMLSCPREERLLSELAAVWGYFLSVIAVLFVMMVFSLTLMARCAAAG